MGRWGVLGAATAIALACAPGAPAGAQSSAAVGYRTAAALRGLAVIRRLPALHVAEVRVADARALRALRRRPGVRFAQWTHARAETSGPTLGAAIGLVVPEWQWSASRSDAVPAWVRAQAASITIAVVDTGADLSVPALGPKAAGTWNVTTNSSEVTDRVGHGTFVASLAAGAPDPTGMAGFGGDARLLVVQANRGGTGFSDVDEAAGISWAVDHGANIVNLSIGGATTSAVEQDAIRYATGKGVLLVAAAGNAAQQGNPTIYPAALIGHAGLVVGAAEQNGARAPFSSTALYVDLLAPGVDVLSAVGAGAQPGLFQPAVTPAAAGSYGYGSGTSYATPEVAGAAALVWAADPSLTASQVADLVDSAASGRGTWSTELAYGDLDVAAAVQAAIDHAAPLLEPPADALRPASSKPKPRIRAKAPTRPGLQQ